MLADRPCGYQVGTNGYAAAPDDTAILNAAIAAAIHLDVPLELHGKWYRHNSGLVAKPTRAAPYQGTTNTTRDIAFWNVLNAQGFEIKGFGNAGLIAGGAMSYQLRVYNDFAIANSIESNWIKVEGIKFNGNALASVSNLYLNWSGNADVVRCGMAGAARAVQVFGYGVFNIYHNDMRASYITVDVQAGGDAVIQDNDIFVEGVGVNAAGNIRVARNTFTGTGFATSGNANRIGITINPVGTNAAGTFPYTYGMRIENNEFNAIDMAVYGNATSSAFHAIHMVSIVNNHVIADQNVMPDVGLCDLTYARTVFIAGNQIGRDVQVVSQNVAIRLTDCEMVHLSNVDFVNIGNSAAVLTRCKNVNGHDCSFTNVSCVVNAMAYSEALQTAPWAQTNLTVVTATTSAVAAGTLLARNGATLQRLQDNTTNGLHGNTQPRTVVSGQPYTITALVKAAELTKCKLVPYASGVGVSFDLSGGTVITKDAGCDGGIDSLGGGVYRIWASLNSAPGTTANPGIYLMNAAGATSYAGTSQGLFAAGLGMVTGYAPPSYIGATGASGSAQPAQIVLTDSDHCNFHDNTVLAKYNHVLPTVHVAETGTSNNNIVKDTVLSDPATITPFFRSGAQSYAVHWEKSAFRVSKTATQSVPTSTSTKITFDSLNLNRGGKFASDKYTPGIGPVDLAGSLRVSGLVVGTAFEVTVTKNGTAIGGSGRLAAATDDTISFAVCDEAAVGDYYEVYLYAAGAGSKTVSNDGRFTYFSGRLG